MDPVRPQLPAEISSKVRPGTTGEDGFDIIVACAACKLVCDLQAVAEAVHQEHTWMGGAGVAWPASRPR